jgi:uncharacterized membrane protein YfcA
VKIALFVALGVCGVLYIVVLAQAVIRARHAGREREVKPTPFSVALGFIASFFDTLGIGSFATVLGGVPAVLLAAFIVKSLPLLYMRWLVVFIVLYAAFSMLRSAVVKFRKEAMAAATVPAAEPAP